ncbi:MAG: class I fructose-bisphosphate aldolase family protein [Thermoanaerobacteraceae bacterium]|nr:class I fructose-bisphosphate aldolase family protein [Thermoanaerobacteraceae bacterium]
MTGKELRLNRLFRHERLLTVPMDHGISLGPIPGLENMSQLVKSVAEGGADAVIIHKGLVKQILPSLSTKNCELIVHLSASTSLAPDSTRKELVSSVEHAIRLGATAVSVHVNLASSYEARMLQDLGKVAEHCELWGLPLLAMMYIRDGSRDSEYHPAKIKHAARVAEEAGADIIKINYTGSVDSFAEITSTIKVPVIIAGGPKLNSTRDLLAIVADAVKAGAKGVSIGRNVFQHPNPIQLVRAIRKILDETVSEQVLTELAATCDA